MKKIIQSRLAKLPPKVALPLTHLVKIGQMREEDIKTVLDAGDLTGNYPHACRLCSRRDGNESAARSGRRYGGHGEETRTTNPIGLEPSPLARGTRPDGESCHTASVQRRERRL